MDFLCNILIKYFHLNTICLCVVTLQGVSRVSVHFYDQECQISKHLHKHKHPNPNPLSCVSFVTCKQLFPCFYMSMSMYAKIIVMFLPKIFMTVSLEPWLRLINSWMLSLFCVCWLKSKGVRICAETKLICARLMQLLHHDSIFKILVHSVIPNTFLYYSMCD